MTYQTTNMLDCFQHELILGITKRFHKTYFSEALNQEEWEPDELISPLSLPNFAAFLL